MAVTGGGGGGGGGGTVGVSHVYHNTSHLVPPPMLCNTFISPVYIKIVYSALPLHTLFI